MYILFSPNVYYCQILFLSANIAGWERKKLVPHDCFSTILKRPYHVFSWNIHQTPFIIPDQKVQYRQALALPTLNRYNFFSTGIICGKCTVNQNFCAYVSTENDYLGLKVPADSGLVRSSQAGSNTDEPTNFNIMNMLQKAAAERILNAVCIDSNRLTLGEVIGHGGCFEGDDIIVRVVRVWWDWWFGYRFALRMAWSISVASYDSSNSCIN